MKNVNNKTPQLPSVTNEIELNKNNSDTYSQCKNFNRLSTGLAQIVLEFLFIFNFFITKNFHS